MTDKIAPPDLKQAESLLAELFEEVKINEGTLRGIESNLGMGATTVESLKETKVSFGNPRDNLILLTEETFKEIGVELTDAYRQQMHKVDFYYMTVAVNLYPRPGVKFWRLYCQLDFSPKGTYEPLVKTMFPQSDWQSLIKLGTGINLGLNANLDWSVGIDGSQIAQLANLPGNIKANVDNKNELKAYIVIPDYSYEMGFFEIVATGIDESTCQWRIEEPKIQNQATAKFAIAFRVPKGCQSIDLEGTVWAEADIDWLVSYVSDLADILRNLLKRDKNEAAKKLSRGDQKKWTLPLATTSINA